MITDIIKRIAELDVKNLSAEEIEKILPEFGMNDEVTEEMPSELSEHFGKGIRFWQYPNQFSKFLKYLHGKKIDTYFEIGTRWGGTFIIINEIIRQTNPGMASYGLDYMEMSDILREYQTISPYHYLQSDSHDTEWVLAHLPKQIDFIFVDGDHSYDGVKMDYELALKLNPKYIMFHDIDSDACRGVVDFWNEIKDQYKHYEFKDQYNSVTRGNYLGIGVIEL